MNPSVTVNSVWITGANGLIGRNLCRKLSSSYEITALDLKGDEAVSNTFKSILIDLTDSDQLKSHLNQPPKIIIHCAGIAHQKIGAVDAATYMSVNSEATENLAETAATKNPDLHFIFLSTISVYGETDLIQPVSEDAQYKPSSDYAFSKLNAEKGLIKLYEKGVLRKLTILRLAPVYDYEFGLNLERRVFAPKKMAYVKFGAGSQTLSALARPNLVEFVDYLLKQEGNENFMQIINVCDETPYTFHEIIHTFKNSGIYPYRLTIPIPLPAVKTATRIAGFIFKNQRQWFHSCYDKVASNLVFDNSRMLNTGFVPKHTLQSIFLDK